MPFRDDILVLNMDDLLESPSIEAGPGEIFAPHRQDGWRSIGTVTSSPVKVRRPGELTRSTSLELESWPSIVWDVNGYYRELGVDFRATKRELTDAYRDRGGPDDARLTFIFSQLLDPEIRRRYDATPLGKIFSDIYVVAEILRKAATKACRMAEAGVITTVEKILEEMDLIDPQDRVDIPQHVGEDKDPEGEWPYTYFVWGMRPQDTPWMASSMQLWQEALSRECQERGAVTAFAVGVMNRPHEPQRSLAMSVAGVTVAFISIKALSEIGELVPHTIDMLTH